MKLTKRYEVSFQFSEPKLVDTTITGVGFTSTEALRDALESAFSQLPQNRISAEQKRKALGLIGRLESGGLRPGDVLDATYRAGHEKLH